MKRKILRFTPDYNIIRQKYHEISCPYEQKMVDLLALIMSVRHCKANFMPKDLITQSMTGNIKILINVRKCQSF